MTRPPPDARAAEERGGDVIAPGCATTDAIETVPGRPLAAAAATVVVAPRAKLEDVVENTLFGVFAYLGRASVTTRDALRHPAAFARSLPSEDYCRPTTYFVIAVFLETWLGTTLIALQRASADSVYDKRTTAELSQALGTGAAGGDWMTLLLMLAPLIGIAALFAAFLHVFAWRRHGLDFQRCFAITCYSIAAPTYVRIALLAMILPMSAAGGGAGFDGARDVVLVAVAALQCVPLLLVWIHLRHCTGRLRRALWLWTQAAACTLVVVLGIAAWSYPLWKDAVKWSS